MNEEFTQAEVEAAATEESAQIANAINEHLRKRTVLQNLTIKRLLAEIESLKAGNAE